MDAFFAAVEERENPRFKRLPIIVGSDPKEGRGRGVVSTANYKAREYGIHSGMPITRAWRLAEEAVRRGEPRAVFLPVNGKFYSEVSETIFKVVRQHVEKIEAASIDEAYLDFSFCDNYEKAEKLARKIKEEIYSREELTCSIGIGPNKLIAKIASGKNKPDGLTVIRPEQVNNFLTPLSVRKIPGVGPKTERLLAKIEVRKISDLQKISREKLKDILGKWGSDLYDKARGINDSPIVEKYEAKSIGEQETFEEDTLNSRFINDRLAKMAEAIIKKCKREGFEGFKTIVIIVRFADFQTKTRSRTLKNHSRDLVELKRESLKMLLPFLDRRENPSGKKIRLIGLRVEKLRQKNPAGN